MLTSSDSKQSNRWYYGFCGLMQWQHPSRGTSTLEVKIMITVDHIRTISIQQGWLRSQCPPISSSEQGIAQGPTLVSFKHLKSDFTHGYKSRPSRSTASSMNRPGDCDAILRVGLHRKGRNRAGWQFAKRCVSMMVWNLDMVKLWAMWDFIFSGLKSLAELLIAFVENELIDIGNVKGTGQPHNICNRSIDGVCLGWLAHIMKQTYI